jgi:hypothetical protein
LAVDTAINTFIEIESGSLAFSNIVSIILTFSKTGIDKPDVYKQCYFSAIAHHDGHTNYNSVKVSYTVPSPNSIKYTY